MVSVLFRDFLLYTYSLPEFDSVFTLWLQVSMWCLRSPVVQAEYQLRLCVHLPNSIKF